VLYLKSLLKSTSLSGRHGKTLSKVTRINVVNRNLATLDFDGIRIATADFFQELMIPLIGEFGSDTINYYVEFANLTNDLRDVYIDSMTHSNKFMRGYLSRKNTQYNEMSNLTFSFLLKAREILKTEPEKARLFFGTDQRMSEILLAMDLDAIQMLANSGIICFQPRFSHEFASMISAMDAKEIDIILNISGSITDIYGN